jgi:hypothetical protein
LAVGERAHGQIFLTANGGRLQRHAAAQIVRRATRAAGIDKNVTGRWLAVVLADRAGRRSARSTAIGGSAERRLPP